MASRPNHNDPLTHVPSGDRFVAKHLGVRIGACKTRGAMLSKVLTYVSRESEDNRGHVEFVSARGGTPEIVFLVRKREGTVYVTTVNDIE